MLGVGDLLRLVHDLEDPLAGRGRALRLADPHAEHPERHDEHVHPQVEVTNAPGESVPWTTMAPPTSSTPACPSSGTNAMSGT